MKLCVTTRATRGIISPEDLMPKLKAWGYGGIEMWGRDLPGAGHVQWYEDTTVRIGDVYRGDRATDEEIDRVVALKNLADRNGLEVPMISPYFDFLQGKKRWEESLVIGQRYIQYAKAMGVRLIRAMSGGYGTGTEVPSASMTDEQWESVLSGLKALVSLPGADQVVFALETHRGKPEDSPSSLLREIEETGSAQLRVLLQPNQLVPVIPGLTTDKMLDALYPYTVHIHVRAPMAGSPVGWSKLLPELQRRGYGGHISLENVKEPRFQSIEDEAQWFRQMVA